jgi:hypothetical protein
MPQLTKLKISEILTKYYHIRQLLNQTKIDDGQNSRSTNVMSKKRLN